MQLRMCNCGDSLWLSFDGLIIGSVSQCVVEIPLSLNRLFECTGERPGKGSLPIEHPDEDPAEFTVSQKHDHDVETRSINLYLIR